MGDKAKGNKKTGKKTAALPFPEKITEFDQYLFGQGTHYDIYKKLGAHPTVKDGKKGVYFAVCYGYSSSLTAIYLKTNKFLAFRAQRYAKRTRF